GIIRILAESQGVAHPERYAGAGQKTLLDAKVGIFVGGDQEIGAGHESARLRRGLVLELGIDEKCRVEIRNRRSGELDVQAAEDAARTVAATGAGRAERVGPGQYA